MLPPQVGAGERSDGGAQSPTHGCQGRIVGRWWWWLCHASTEENLTPKGEGIVAGVGGRRGVAEVEGAVLGKTAVRPGIPRNWPFIRRRGFCALRLAFP